MGNSLPRPARLHKRWRQLSWLAVLIGFAAGGWLILDAGFDSGRSGAPSAATPAPTFDHVAAPPKPDQRVATPSPGPPAAGREPGFVPSLATQRGSAADPDDPALGLSLDDATPGEVRARLATAIELARETRGVHVSDQVLPMLVANDNIRILVLGPSPDERLSGRLVGTRHRPLRDYHHLPLAAVEVGPQALLEIVESPDVVDISIDQRRRPSLSDTVPLIRAHDAQDAGFDGSNRVIAIVDTGVDTTHPAFERRVLEEACFSTYQDCPNGFTSMFGPGAGAPCDFNCGHGTHVAGVALGFEVDGLSGVALDAGLISIQVFSDDNGSPKAFDSDVIAALEHVYDLSGAYDIASVNLSLGGESGFVSEGSCDLAHAAYKAAVDKLRQVQIAVVASAGNDAFEGMIAAPACVSSVVSVGATTKQDLVADFSNSANFLALLAPGEGVNSPAVGGGYSPVNGTSFAAPHVSGSFASLLESSPGSNVDEILFALVTTGVPIRDTRNDVVTPRIDVSAAIELLDAGVHIPTEEERIRAVFGEGLPSDECGLIGLEPLAPLLVLQALRRRRRSRGCNDSRLKQA